MSHETVQVTHQDKVIVLIRSKPPVMLDRVQYYVDAGLKSIFEDQEKMDLPKPGCFLSEGDGDVKDDDPGDQEAEVKTPGPARANMEQAAAPPPKSSAIASRSWGRKTPTPEALAVQAQRAASYRDMALRVANSLPRPASEMVHSGV